MTTQSQLSEAIEKAVGTCNIETIQKLPPIEQSIALANGMRALRAALTDDVIANVFMPLQGTKLGFRTDKDAGQGYPVTVVRECLIEAMIRGFQPIGNEMNIIAGNAYFTKEGYERKVAQFPGLTDFEGSPGVVHVVRDVGALVPYHASWKLNGAEGSLVCDVVEIDGKDRDRRIMVKVNSGMGSDAILGKAKRKFYARVYEKLSGVKPTDGDVDDLSAGAINTDGVDRSRVAEKTDDLVNKHRQKSRKSEPAERVPGEEG
jgi:hypothetical protein